MSEPDEMDQRAREAFFTVQRMAGIGAWELCLATGQCWLSPVTMDIYGVESMEGFDAAAGIRHFSSEAQPLISSAVDRATSSGERFDLEVGFFNSRGDRLWVRTIGEAEVDAGGKPQRLVGVFQDITSRKRVEVLAEALRLIQSKEGKGDVQTLLDPLWDATRMIRAPIESLLFIPFRHSGAHEVGFHRSTDGEWMPLLRQGDESGARAWRDAENGPLPATRWQDLATLVDPAASPAASQHCVRSEGSLIWVSCNRGSELNPFEKSALLELAQALDRAQDRLLERERAQALDAQLRQSQRLDAIGRLAGGVAHDFNNLLMVIRGTCELRTITGRFSFDDFKVIDDAAARGQELTQQLLEFSKLHPVKPQVLDLNESVAKIAKFVRRVVGDDVQVDVQPCDGVAAVVFARGQLDRLIMNLVVNARDAMPSGGKLTIVTRRYVVESASGAKVPLGPGQYFQLIVQDTGIGMDSDLRELIFEPFVSTKAVGQGSGLGLSMAHGAVTQFGGHIGVQSQVGKGSTFTVTLPRAEEDVPLETESTRGLTGIERGIGRILVVEDEPVVRRLTVEMLNELGFEASSASGLDDVRHLLTHIKRPFDGVVCDVVMPGGNGPTVIEEVRRKCGNLPVVFVSGHMTERDEDALRKTPNSSFLQKPFTGGELFHEVSHLLDRQRQMPSG